MFFVKNISKQSLPTQGQRGLIPHKLQFMTDGRGHIHSEQTRDGVGGLCVYMSVCVRGLVTLFSRPQHCYTKSLRASKCGGGHVLLMYCLSASPWNDYINPCDKTVAIISIYNPLLNLVSCTIVSVLSLRGAIMQMRAPRWRCVSACRWCVWDEWVWEKWMIGTFSCNCFDANLQFLLLSLNRKYNVCGCSTEAVLFITN